jgi:hypothetical protein
MTMMNIMVKNMVHLVIMNDYDTKKTSVVDKK